MLLKKLMAAWLWELSLIDCRGDKDEKGEDEEGKKRRGRRSAHWRQTDKAELLLPTSAA